MSAAGMGASLVPDRADGGLRGLVGDPLFGAAGLVFAAMLLPTYLAFLVDDRQHLGLDIWLKPMKFEAALAIFCVTMAIYARWLPDGMTGRLRYRIYVASAVAAMAVEMAWIAGAAALGTSSHFNPTPRGQAIYQAMGLLAVWFTASTAVFGIAIARSDRLAGDPAPRLGLALGLGLTFVLTVVFAGQMAQSGSHFVGEASSDAGGLWPMGWSRRVGDLRVAHFLGTHAMHAVPLAGFVAGRLMAPRPAMLATWGAAAAWTALCVAVFVQALAGLPLVAAG